MSRQKNPSTKVESLLKQTATLSKKALKALMTGLQGLTQSNEADEHGKPLNQKGYVEEKTVNGCGPYRYLRYSDGKTHKSVYLG